MSKPQLKELSMYYVEGNPTAQLVMTVAGRMKATVKRFPTPEAALAWCRQHRSRFVYLPADLSGN